MDHEPARDGNVWKKLIGAIDKEADGDFHDADTDTSQLSGHLASRYHCEG